MYQAQGGKITEKNVLQKPLETIQPMIHRGTVINDAIEEPYDIRSLDIT